MSTGSGKYYEKFREKFEKTAFKHFACVDTDGSFTCNCNPRFQLTGDYMTQTCVDNDALQVLHAALVAPVLTIVVATNVHATVDLNLVPDQHVSILTNVVLELTAASMEVAPTLTVTSHAIAMLDSN